MVNLNTNTFFNEWDDKNKALATYGVAEAILIFIILHFVLNLFPEQIFTITIFLFFLIVGSIVAGLDLLNEDNEYFSFVSYGNSFNRLLVGLVFGLIVGVVLNIGVIFNEIIPFSFAIASIQVGGFFPFLYIVIASPLVEELFFRSFLNPTSIQLLKNWSVPFAGFVGIVLSSVLFGLYHLGTLVFVNPSVAWVVAFGMFFLGLIWSLGNYFFQSKGFGVGSHVVFNFIKYVAIYGWVFL